MVLLGGPRRSANQFLGVFLLLIAGNQAAEVLRTVAEVAAGSEAAGLGWHRAAAVFGALDPFALYYFASIYPARNSLNETWKVALVGGLGAAFAVGAPSFVGTPPFDLGLSVYTAATYTVVLVRMVRALLASPPLPQAVRLLYPALCVAALPAWTRTATTLADALALGGGAGILASQAIPVALPFAAVLLLAREARRARAPESLRALAVAGGLGGAGLSLLLHGNKVSTALAYLGSWDPTAINQVLNNLSQASAPVRWLVFGTLVSMAVLRHQMLGMSLAMRRLAARFLVGLAFLAAAAIGLAAARVLVDTALPLTPVEGLLLLVVVVASQGFRSLVDRVAAKVYGVPTRADLAGSIEAYRRAVEQSRSEGSAALAEFERLREELGLDARTAQVVRRMVEAAPGGPLGPGEVVAGRYRVERFLGRGGAGRVFLARDELLDRDVVVKELLHGPEGAAAAALREARLAGSLQHPNVVSVFDVVQRPGASLLVTEFVAGGSLEDRVSKGRLPLAEGLRVLDGVLAGLEALHARGVVHRDLKPANVLMSPDGAPKIADFGIALGRAGSTAQVGKAAPFAGTPEFLAPEVRRGERATHASDLYAVGLLARRSVQAPLPGAVELAVARALQEDPGERWASATEMRKALAQAGLQGPGGSGTALG